MAKFHACTSCTTFPASTAEPYTPLGAPGLAAGSSPCSGPGSANITGPGADPAFTGVTPDVTEPDVSIEEVHDAICGLMGRWLLPSEAALPPLRSARVSSAHCAPATPVDWLGACGLALGTEDEALEAEATAGLEVEEKVVMAADVDGLHETLALLTSQLRPDANHKEDLGFLKDVFSEKSLTYLMKIHEKLQQYERQSPTPILHTAHSLAEDVAEELQSGPMGNDEKELFQLLNSPHLKAVLTVHDTVAQKNFDPVLPPLPEDFEDELEEESVKIVRLVKNKEPLGATIRRDETTGAVIVARIMRGGAADRSGLVHVGDEFREVNGILIVHKRPDEISQILSQSQGSITLKIIPAIKEEDRLKESKVKLDAM
ncbi:UNVERIFIED_CONTAM: hypothetical protein FKN15_009332 [Acipenser sinensis]